MAQAEDFHKKFRQGFVLKMRGIALVHKSIPNLLRKDLVEVHKILQFLTVALGSFIVTLLRTIRDLGANVLLGLLRKKNSVIISFNAWPSL